jgi:hypothetical protein
MANLRQIQLDIAEIVLDLINVAVVRKLDIVQLNIKAGLRAGGRLRQRIQIGLFGPVQKFERLVARRPRLSNGGDKHCDLFGGKGGIDET